MKYVAEAVEAVVEAVAVEEEKLVFQNDTGNHSGSCISFDAWEILLGGSGRLSK